MIQTTVSPVAATFLAGRKLADDGMLVILYIPQVVEINLEQYDKIAEEWITLPKPII